MVIEKDVTIDLNGKTLTGNVADYLFVTDSNVNLTIKNGYITCKGGAVAARAGQLNMIDCNVTMTGDQRRNAVKIVGDVQAVITGGSYTYTGTLAQDQETDCYGIGISDGDVVLDTEVSGFPGGVSLAPGADDSEWPNVTINGGNYIGTEHYGLFMSGGDLTLNGEDMEFNGKNGDIYVYTYTGTINDVTFDFGASTYTLETLNQKIEDSKQ